MKQKEKIIIFAFLFSVAQIGFSESTDKKGATIYNPAGKRDPFKVLSVAPVGRKVSAIYPTEKYDLDQLNLRAILRMGGRSRALIEAPDGQTFIINEGEIVGRERATLSRVLKTEIILTQQSFNYLGSPSLVERIISLPPESSGLVFETSGDEPAGKTVGKRAPSSKMKGRRNQNRSPDSEALDSVKPPLASDVKKILDRPAQLESELDEIMGVTPK
ncbi:hypothetical protein EBQ74_11695 [bacterium]|nr:hypothetical protein [bacterium]